MTDSLIGNTNVDWNAFDSEAYCEHNYQKFRPHNAGIVASIAEYLKDEANKFSTCADIGTGSNLYPSLALVPWARRIDLYDPSTAIRAWLENELQSDGERWNPYWQVLYGSAPSKYKKRLDWAKFKKLANIIEGGINNLPERKYDIATMFFVAESVTSVHAEFEQLTIKSVASVRPGGKFLSAFMLGSTGYPVGDVRYPAVKLTEDSLDFLRSLLSDTYDIPIERGRSPVRNGYSGMHLLMGTVRG